MKQIELLAPAGGRESLEAAVYFGADAVYAAGKTYGLRAFADNFTIPELKDAAKYVHRHGKRIYITLNAIFHERDFAGLEEYIAALRDADVDALIISDPGVLQTAKRVAPGMPLHLSTQANTTNQASARFWHQQGVSRVSYSHASFHWKKSQIFEIIRQKRLSLRRLFTARCAYRIRGDAS